jgi:DNA-binding NarL/FixJ family response regulator
MRMNVTDSTGNVPAKASVLIVDDDRGFGRAAAEILAGRGYLVLGHATTAVAALAKCEHLRPEAVLVDVRLPDANGVILAQRLRERPDRPAVLLTSSDRRAVLAEPLRASGASGFVPKTELARSDLDSFLRC